MIADEVSACVDGEHLLWGEFALVDSAWAHRESERFVLDDGAQITARPEEPPARVQTPGDRGETRSELGKIFRHDTEDATKSTFCASVGWQLLTAAALSAGDADAAADERFDVHWHSVGFCFANKLGVDLEDAQLHYVFHLEIA